MAVLFRGVKNKKARVTLLRIHRLLEFQQAFDEYLAGRCPAAHVTERARKMLAVGLPSRLK